MTSDPPPRLEVRTESPDDRAAIWEVVGRAFGQSDEAGLAFQARTLGDPALVPRGGVRYPAPFGIQEA